VREPDENQQDVPPSISVLSGEQMLTRDDRFRFGG